MMRSGNNVIIKKEKVPRKITTWTQKFVHENLQTVKYLCNIIHETKMKKDIYLIYSVGQKWLN